jgi:hypothetical protein
MKKAIIVIALFAAVLILSISIIDSSSTVADYMIYNSSLDKIGRWQNTQDTDKEIELFFDETFCEYYKGGKVAYGVYQSDNNTITLNYEPSSCSAIHRWNCSRRMRFYLDNSTLILEDIESEVLFTRNDEL